MDSFENQDSRAGLSRGNCMRCSVKYSSNLDCHLQSVPTVDGHFVDWVNWVDSQLGHLKEEGGYGQEPSLYLLAFEYTRTRE